MAREIPRTRPFSKLRPLEETEVEPEELTSSSQVEPVAGQTHAHGTPAPDPTQVTAPVNPGQAVAGMTHAHGTPWSDDVLKEN